MSLNLTKEEAKQIISDLLSKAHNRFKQELAGENEEFLDRVVRQYRAKVARCSWKASQKWCKWNDEGPVLMPDYTRMYYRKANTEVLVLEYPPQVRLMKFKGSLAKRSSSTAELDDVSHNDVYHYSLALPYVVFLFKYVNGTFTEVRCAFSDRPLKRLEEKPIRPYMSNIDSNLSVCLGSSFDRAQLIKDNVVQQSALVLSHFWQTIYSDEWSSHFWANKSHFEGGDERMSTLDKWQEASEENPLFVIEDVPWLNHHEENFGDMVVRMFEDDSGNVQLHEELYTELVNNFLEEVTKTFGDNLDTVEQKMIENNVDQLADDLLAKLNEKNEQ
jgi:hypothetical protein